MNRDHWITWAMLAALPGLSSCVIERDVPTSPYAADAGIEESAFGQTSSADTAGTTGTGGAVDGATAGGAAGSGAAPASDAPAPSDAGAPARDSSLSSVDPASIPDRVRAPSDPADAASDAAATCVPPAVTGCNPVTNDGCAPELQMQCAVDVAAPSPTGYCIFSAPMDAGACFNSGLTESCPPTTTCVGGECRPLCFCDADCEEGKCCAEPIGITGFNVCGDC
jgi:hypothetical protein